MIRKPLNLKRAKRRERRGGIFTVEFLMVTPLLGGVLLAIVQFSFLFAASHQVQVASEVACRVGTRPASDPDAQDAAVRAAANEALAMQQLIDHHELVFSPGSYTGDRTIVEIQVPMTAAAPNALAVFGVTFEGQNIVARTVMRRE